MGAEVMWSLFQDMPQARPCGRELDFGPGHPLDRFPLSPCLSRTVLKQGPHPLGSVGKFNTVVSDRYAQRMA